MQPRSSTSCRQTLNPEWTRTLGPESDRIHAECLHRPGNLSLSAYNQELWNHPFAIKRQRYAQSNIVLTRELADYATWGEAEIEKRGRQLAADASAIWIGPKEPVAREHPADDEDEGQGDELSDASGPASTISSPPSVRAFPTSKPAELDVAFRPGSATLASSFDSACVTTSSASTSGSGATHRGRFGSEFAKRRDLTTS